VLRTSAMVAQDSPVLQAGDGVLDASAAAAVASPRAVAQDAPAAEDRCDQLVDAAVTAVGQDASVEAAECLDRGAAVVHRIVAIAGATGGRGDDAEIAAARQDLGIA
jgi:hypothetical protein